MQRLATFKIVVITYKFRVSAYNIRVRQNENVNKTEIFITFIIKNTNWDSYLEKDLHYVRFDNKILHILSWLDCLPLNLESIPLNLESLPLKLESENANFSNIKIIKTFIWKFEIPILDAECP